MASVQAGGAGAGAELLAISQALGLERDEAAGAGVDVAELLTAIRKLKQQSQPQPQQQPSPQQQSSPQSSHAPVVVPRSRSNSVCVSGSGGSSGLMRTPAVMLTQPDPARCDVVIRCRILNARLPSVQRLLTGLEEGKAEDEEGEEGDDEASVAAAGPSAMAAPATSERKEVSSDEEQEDEVDAEAGAEATEAAAAAAEAGKRKRADSTMAAESGVEGHKKAKSKPAMGEAAACASEHSCSSSSSSACFTLTAATGGAKKAAVAVATTPEQYQVRVLHAEGAILGAQSEYFARAFGGGWKESGSRELALTFDDEEGAWMRACVRTMDRICCVTTYAKR